MAASTHLTKLPQERKEREGGRNGREWQRRKDREVRRREHQAKSDAREELVPYDVSHRRMHAREPDQHERRDRQRPSEPELRAVPASLGDGDAGDDRRWRRGECERQKGGARLQRGEPLAGLKIDWQVDWVFVIFFCAGFSVWFLTMINAGTHRQERGMGSGAGMFGCTCVVPIKRAHSN